MARRRKPLHNSIDEAEDVLAGRNELDVRALLDLVHAINPSGRDLDDQERARRYDLKSRLQSLLVRNFRDELVVALEPKGVVSIAHRYLGRDACHAQLDSLDADARAWVQWRLDTADDDVESLATGSSSPTTPAGPLERGRQALAEYDYEVARVAFREAFEISPDNVAASRCLLELLVDLLAQDDEALALADRLPRSALADIDIRSTLALAAARSGDSRRARRWLVDLAGTRAAEAWVVLGQTALANDAFDDVERAIREANTCDPAQPSTVELRSGLAARRRELRAPDETRLEALIATADDATLRTQAREVLARWPDSTVAAKLLNAIDQRERQREAARLIAASETALTAGDPQRARELADRAAMLGEDVKQLVAVITRADVAARELRRATDLDHVLALLESDPLAAYAAYLALEPALRERVRSRNPLDALGWLDALATNRARTAPRIIAAVHAFEIARAAEAEGDHAAALRTLDEHEPLLAELRDARQLRDRLRERLATDRRHLHETLLADALAAWRELDVERTTRLLTELDVRVLGIEERARAAELDNTVRRHRGHQHRLSQIDALLADGRLLDARHELERSLGDHLPPDDDLTRRLADVRDTIRATWHIEHAASGPIDVRRLGAALGPMPYEAQPEPWVTADGQIVLAAAHDRLVIVAILDVEHDRLEMRAVTTPAPIGSLITARVDHDRLWLAGQQWLVQLDIRTGELCRWRSLAEHVLPEHVVERVFIFPDESTMWLETMHKGIDSHVQLIDLATWRVIRTPSSSRFLHEVPGQPTLIAALDFSGGAAVYTGRGRLAGELIQIANHRATSLVRHPLAEGFIAAVSDPDDEDAGEIVLVELIGGRVHRKLTLDNTDPDRIFSLVAARSDQLLFAFHRYPDGAELLAIRPTTPELEIVYRIPAPVDLVLVHDPSSDRAFAIWDSTELGFARLGATPPLLDADSSRDRLPSFESPFTCSYASKPHALEPAEAAAREHRWDLVRDLLAPISADDLDAELRRHFHHLQGLAFARTGDLAAATRSWDAGRALPVPEGRLFPCPLDACLELIADLPDPLPSTWWDHTTSPLRQLRAAIATADACRARRDDAGALAALRRRVVYASRELQSLGRLADLVLESSEIDSFERTCVLASFLDAWNGNRSRDLPVPGAWNDDTLNGVVERARHRLGF